MERIALEIAGLPFLLGIPSSWVSVIKEKWTDFLSPKRQPIACGQVFEVTKEDEIRVEVDLKGRQFKIFSQNPKSFRQFSDCLRAAVNPFLISRRAFILHASSVIDQSWGFIFAGQEGAGKSTTQKKLSYLTSLGDDSALIRKQGDEFFLFGSPFYERSKKIYPNKKVPIKGVFFLKRSIRTGVKSLKKAEAYAQILANIRFFALRGNGIRAETKMAAENASQFCQKGYFFQLFFTKKDPFWFLARKVADLPKRVSPKLWRRLPSLFWQEKKITKKDLGELLVINEVSWYFEFGGRRKVSQVARLVRKGEIEGRHTSRINKMIKAGVNPEIPLVAIKREDERFLVDGNHRAVALFLLDYKNPLPLLFGRLTKNK